jgi:signal peptidase I
VAKTKKKQRPKQAPAAAPPLPAPAPARKKHPWREWVRSILIAVFIALMIRWPLIEPFRIPSGSMEPTLQDKDRIFVNKWKYGVRYPFNGFRIPFTRTDIWFADGRLLPVSDPQRWDIVVFKAAVPGVPKHTLVKRLIGLPGERIHIEDGRIYANGEVLEPPEDMPDIYYTSPIPGTLSSMRYGIRTDDEYALVPEGYYLVLGDNSAFSADGRYFGWLPERNLLGPVTTIWWPVGRWRDFTGFSDTWWWRTLVAALAAYTIGRLFFARSWRAYDTLFQGAIRKGDHLFINRIRFGVPLPLTRKRLTPGAMPKHGDIVLYHTPNRQPGQPELLLGRVAGLPGEQVQLADGRLLIDGAAPPTGSALATLDLSRDAVGNYARSKSREYAHVPDDHVFVLLDESDGAEDSRALGWIPKENVVGSVVGVWWPPHRIRAVK